MDRRSIYQTAFASLRGINRVLGERLLACTGSEEGFFEASESRLRALSGFQSGIFKEDYRRGLVEKARAEVEFTDYAGIRRLYFTDDDYPQRLAQCDDAPLMLFSMGDSPLNDGLFLGIVGTRHATPYGIAFVEKLIEQLGQRLAQPLTIVSGLAFGIDIAAHRAALRRGLNTVAVLAHGLNTIYPGAHRNDAARMAQGGGRLLTEYPSSAPVHKGNFLARNRIVAGISDAVIVVESAEKGGALTTARIAADYHRDVFALPGRTSDPYSRGCNRLIARNAAALIQSADDLIDAMGWPCKPTSPEQGRLFPEMTPDEQRVVDLLTRQGEAGINRLSVELDINVGRLTALLIDMEFKGLVIKFPGGKYRPA